MTSASSRKYSLFYQVIVVFVVRLRVTQGVINLCQKVYPPVTIGELENCSLACSPKFLNFDPNDDLYALCTDNKSSLLLPCKTNNDCRHHHVRATCRRIPCLCEGGGPFGNQTVYVLNPKIRIPNIDVCTVSHKGLDKELPPVLPPFPWKTLLVVFGIVASCAACLVAVRWVSPYIRRMQAKSTTRNHQNRRSENDGATLFTSHPLPERTYIRPCSRYSNRRAYPPPTSTNNSDCNADKPPPYELAIQAPPAYDEVEEEEPLNPVLENPGPRPVFLPNSRPASVATV